MRHVGRLLNCTHAFCLLELENHGDLVGLISEDGTLSGRGEWFVLLKSWVMLRRIWLGVVRFVKVIIVKLKMRAADFGRRRVAPHVIDAGRNVSGVCER